MSDLDSSSRARARLQLDKEAILTQLSQTMDEVVVCGRERDFNGLHRAMATIDAAFARLAQINQEARNG